MHFFTKTNPVIQALTAAVVVSLVATLLYVVLEPATMSAASATKGIIVSQDIGAEISFASSATTTLTMSGTIGGTTGGTETGSTTVYVTTNNSAGYTMTIKFASTTGMVHANGVDSIAKYSTTSVSYNLNNTATSAFAYSIQSNSAATVFKNNGSSACNASGGTSSYQNCYYMQSDPTAPYTIVSTTSPQTSDATVINFIVDVKANSGLPNGTYYATTTLTATTN